MNFHATSPLSKIMPILREIKIGSFSKQCIYMPGADKSLARLGRKQPRKHARDARDFDNIETRAVINFLFP